ncbi:molybdopterin-dependent oxidoreductase [Hydrogenophaga sp.]|uniref:molybdopterin-dependent oxidoreductase n=1 Tax=Hydrogenophaga sp. TaxID=1904254 RepID=UPI0027178C6A|nr:molybdopterin-dependent oxidoreductase [Hydrogenophaga sp.]MDO9435724.1 molybdopterin-dependent oxidoreductase [Hydrogenophaga sp.]
MERRFTHSSHWGAFEAVVRHGRLVAAEPLAIDQDPSAILAAMPEMVHSDLRVDRPMFRKGWLEHGPGKSTENRASDPFVALPWDEALDRVAQELNRVRTLHGNAAIFSGSYGWSSAGRFHHAKTQMQRFINLIGGSTTHVHSYSFAAAQALLPHVIGTLDPVVGPVSSWDGIVDHTQLMVCFGGIPLKNAQVEAGGVGAHTTADWLRRAKAAGVQFVNISPLSADIPASTAAQWMPVRPGTDTALLLGIAHTLMVEALHDRAFVESHCVGYGAFAAYVRGDTDGVPKSAVWAAAITGIPADAICTLARRMARSRTMIAMAWSLQRADHGEQPYWAAIAVAAMLGQIGLPGGGFGFGYGAEAGMGNPRRRLPNPTHQAGRNPTNSWIPVARVSDMLLRPGAPYEYNGATRSYPDIRLVYWCGGNPFHHHQDLNRLVRAFRKPETIIVNECWWTSTARHADIVLPATVTLERNDIGAAARDRYLVAMKQAVQPAGEARADFDIFRGLAARCGVEEAFTEGRSEAEWLRHLYDTARERARELGTDLPDFDQFWERGTVEVAAPNEPHTLFEAFRRSPLEHPLKTPSGRIEIFSRTIADFGYGDCPGHPVWLASCEWLGSERAQTYPLHMMSNQPRTRLHSQMDPAGASQQEKIQGREPLRLHPVDAAQRGIHDGDIVKVWNDRGALLAGAVLCEQMMCGVVQLATGAWYDPVQPFGLDKHGNPNVLTLDKGTSRLGQGSIANSCLVQVARWEGPLPDITVHRPPTIVSDSRE